MLIASNKNIGLDPLPGDVPSLHTLVRQLRSELLIEKLGRQKAEAKVKDLLRRMFGPKSERMSALQGLLFGAASAAEQASGSAREALKLAQAVAKRVIARRSKRRIPENLPVLETVRIDPPEAEREGLVRIRDEVSYEEDYKPSQFFRRAIVRGVFAHPKKLHGPKIAPLPPRVIPQSRVGPGFLAYMLTSKYVDHVPYHRQQRIDRRGGLELPAKLRVRYTEQCALLLLTVYQQLKALILASGYVSADETKVKLLDPDRRHKAQDAYLWVYRSATALAIVFEFSTGRGADNLEAFFPESWCGELQSDGYSAYIALAKRRPGIVTFGCWTHARRRAADALKAGEGERAQVLLNEIGELYAIETEADRRGYSAAQRSYYRYAKCRPVFRRLKKRFEALKASELPSSHLGDAAAYALNRWSELLRYAKPGYGHVHISQNAIEGDIRPTKLGSKNWLHIGHPKAGWRSAVIYSIVSTCRLLKVDPLGYLTWLLPKLAAARTRAQDITGLLPHDYARLHPNTS
jgi:hypothetical protein